MIHILLYKKYFFFHDLKPKPSENDKLKHYQSINQAWNDGHHIRIFGHGTLSGDFIPHPNYADPPVRGICISNSDLNNPVILRANPNPPTLHVGGLGVKVLNQNVWPKNSLFAFFILRWASCKLGSNPRNTLKSFLLLNLFLECLDDLWLISRWTTMRSSPSTQ